jgi:hypothetical protein
MIESNLLRAALEYAEAGIPVFPCEPDGKAPATTRSFDDATIDLGQIKDWWGAGQRYNIGLRPADAGWIVLNADLHKGVDPDLLSRLPETFSVETPRGGRHFYFESPTEHGDTMFGQHIDVRSANGYVLAPESVVNGKPYRVISNCGRLAPFPAWAAEHLALRAGHDSSSSPSSTPDFDWNKPVQGLVFFQLAPATIKRLLGKPGGRSAVCLGFLWVCQRSGYTPEQVFKLFQEYCDEPAVGHYRERPAGFEVSLRSEIVRVFSKPSPHDDQAEAKAKSKNRFGGLSPSQGATLPPLAYWDDSQTLPRSDMGSVGFLVGQYGSHKTGAAIMLALDAINRHGARVLFIAAEDANGVAKTRLPAACSARGIQLAEIGQYWRTETETFDLLSDSDRKELIEAYDEFGPDIIIIDVLTRVVTADINAPETGMRVMQAAYALAEPFGATVVIAHHPGLNSGGRPMGSSLFTALADFSLKLSHKDGVVSTHVEKMKNGPDGVTVHYKAELATFFGKDTGLMIQAPIVRAMSAAELEAHKAKKPPKPDLAAENATDAPAIANLAPDVLNALRKITKPTLLREIAPMLDATADGADAKDAEKGTPLTSRIKRLQRLIGSATSPGVLAPFTAPRTPGKTSAYRLMPIGIAAWQTHLSAD